MLETKLAGSPVPSDESIDQAAKIVMAYVGRNALSVGDLTKALRDVYGALHALGTAPEAAVNTQPSPAVPVRKSVTPDFIICLEDGKKFKSMRRHLSLLGMTPEQYRAKWGLPADYPMVAPSYSEQRSGLALAAGLGRKAAPAAARRRSAKK